MGEADAPGEVVRLTVVGFAGAEGDLAQGCTQEDALADEFALDLLGEVQAGGEALVFLEFGQVGGVCLAIEGEKAGFRGGEGDILCDEQMVSFGWWVCVMR